MATIAQLLSTNKSLSWYADLDGTPGICRLTAGGFVFLADGSKEWRLVDSGNADLMRYGQIDLADAQQRLDGNLLMKACGF